jgi:hypothetical protein
VSQQSGGAPAFTHAYDRYSSTSQPSSTGTWGSRRPEPMDQITMSPSLPTFTLSFSSRGLR